jgi:hypothetical protein
MLILDLFLGFPSQILDFQMRRYSFPVAKFFCTNQERRAEESIRYLLLNISPLGFTSTLLNLPLVKRYANARR